MKHKKVIFNLLIALALTAPAYAAEETTYDMEEIIVNADREQATIDQTNIDVKYVSPGGTDRLTDILNQVAGIDIHERTGHGDNQDGTVTLRGFDSRRFTVLVDGVPTTMAGVMAGTYMDWDSIPVSTIEKIEIIKGAKSAAYDNTLGGVINIITKKSGAADGEVSILRGQYNKQQYKFNYGAAQGKLNWQVNYDKSSEDAFLRNNNYDVEQYGLKLDYSFSPQDEWKFNIRQSQEKRGYILENMPGQVGYDSAYPTIGANQAEQAYGGYGDPTRGEPLHNGAYWKKYNTNYDTSWTHYNDHGFLTLDYWSSKERRQEVDYNTNGSIAMDRTIISDQSSGWLLNGQTKENGHTYQYGVDYKRLRYGYGWYNVLPSSMSAADANDLYPSQKVDLYGTYVDDTWALTSRWTSNIGLRYDKMKGETDDSRGDMPTMNYNSLSPKFNFSFRNNDSTTTFIDIDRVWRAPSMAEYWGWSYQSAWGKLGVGLPLKPEQGWSYETGVKHRFSDQYNTKLSFYYQDISDYINFQHSFPFSCYNIPSAKLWGFEWENNFQLTENSRLMVNYTNQHTQKSGVLPGDTAGLSGELDYQPRHKIGLTYLYDQKPWQFRYQMTYMGPQSALESSTPVHIGGYVVGSASLTRQIGKDRTCTLAVDNLFDKNYVEEYGYPMQGRVFSISITQKI